MVLMDLPWAVSRSMWLGLPHCVGASVQSELRALKMSEHIPKIHTTYQYIVYIMHNPLRFLKAGVSNKYHWKFQCILIYQRI